MIKEGNIGIVEFKSISKGIIVTDEMLKAADVRIVFATALCPGKYISVIEGEISAVNSSIKVANIIGGRHVFSSFAINSINKEIIEAINGKVSDSFMDSIAIIESLQIAELIKAADISMDSAEVKILELRLGRGCGVNSFYIITGMLTAVNEATENAVLFLKELGALTAYSVIASPDKDLKRWVEPALLCC